MSQLIKKYTVERYVQNNRIIKYIFGLIKNLENNSSGICLLKIITKDRLTNKIIKTKTFNFLDGKTSRYISIPFNIKQEILKNYEI